MKNNFIFKIKGTLNFLKKLKQVIVKDIAGNIFLFFLWFVKYFFMILGKQNKKKTEKI